MSLYSKALATLLSGISLLFGCNQAPDEIPQPPPVEIIVATPIKKQIVEWDEYVGRLDAVDFVEVRARVSGYLQSIHFEEGQIVKKGDLLSVIDPRPFTAELNRAKAELEQAKARARRSPRRSSPQATAEESGRGRARLCAAALSHGPRPWWRRTPSRRTSSNCTNRSCCKHRRTWKRRRAQIAVAEAAIATATAAVEPPRPPSASPN